MSRTFVLIRAGERRKLVRIGDVEEIVAMMRLEGLDDSSGRCRGMVNLRGAIVPVFDVTGAEAPLSPERFIVVAPFDGAPVGLLVDDVLDVIEIPEDCVVTRPVGPGRERELARLDRDLLPVLEPRDVVGETS